MPQATNTLTAFDALIESRVITFDYGPMLASTNSIVSVPSVFCNTITGLDQNSSAHIIGSPQVGESPSTTIAGQAVLQEVGSLLANVTYNIGVIVTCSDGTTRPLYQTITSVGIPGQN